MGETGSAFQQSIVPYLVYEDAPAALEFLCKAFGFDEKDRFEMDDGRIGHAELSLDGQSIYLASVYREFGFMSPLELEGVHTQVLVYVDDVDAHHARARAAGATIARAPEDQPHGGRMYRAMDPEGHHWMISSRGAAGAS